MLHGGLPLSLDAAQLQIQSAVAWCVSVTFALVLLDKATTEEEPDDDTDADEHHNSDTNV